jgi:hypothetical protein
MLTLIALAVPAVVLGAFASKLGAEDRPGFDESKRFPW